MASRRVVLTTLRIGRSPGPVFRNYPRASSTIGGIELHESGGTLRVTDAVSGRLLLFAVGPEDYRFGERPRHRSCGRAERLARFPHVTPPVRRCPFFLEPNMELSQ